MLILEHCAMMFIYVIAVYVSSDPGTYMVRTRFTFKIGCDISGINVVLTLGPLSYSSTGRFKDLLIITSPHPLFCFKNISHLD